jgi:hypothetical protein
MRWLQSGHRRDEHRGLFKQVMLSPTHHALLPLIPLSTNGITDRESSQREFCNTIEGRADKGRAPANFR